MPAQEIIPSGIALNSTLVTISGKLPATLGPKTSAASLSVTFASDISGLAVTGPLTDAQLRASAVPVTVGNFPATQAVSIAAPVAVTGTFWQATQPVSIAATVAVSGPLTDAQLRASAILVNQAGVSATGSLAALNATVALSLNGATGFAVDLRGPFVATVTFQGTIDGTNWFTLAVIPAGSGANVASVTTATTAGAWIGNANGMQQVRAIATAFTSGSVTVTLRAMMAAGMVTNLPAGQTTQAVSGTVTVTGGTVNPVVPATPYILNSAASTNEALILTGTSGLQAFYATNIGATPAFVKLYNKATAPISTDIPAMILAVPAAVSGVPGVCTLPIGFSGFRFALGLGIRITGAVADNDTTAVAAGQVKVMLSRTV